MYIKIELSDDGIWGPEGTAGYNTAASLDNLEAQLHQALEAEFPDADIDIDVYSIHDGETVLVDDMDNEAARRVVSEVASRVWTAFEWMIEL